MQQNTLDDRKALSAFLDEVAKAPLMPIPDHDGMPYLETTREIINFYLKTPAMRKNFDETGYFIFHNVKIYETGKRDAVIEKMNKHEEDRRLGIKL